MSPPDERPLFSRRHAVIGGVFAAASGIAYARQPIARRGRMPPGTLESWMPSRVGPWTFATSSGAVLPPQDALSDRIYDNLVTRRYAASTDIAVMAVIAYSNVQDGLLQVHRPEFCYTAGGFALSPTRNVILKDARGRTIGANTFIATGQDRVEQVLYWTRIGHSFPQSWPQQRMAVIEANLSRQIPDGLLARVSVILPDARPDLAPLETFAAALDAASPPQLRTLLFGSA